MDLVIRVRAAGDSSLTSVFRPLLAASAQAHRQVEASVAASGGRTQSIYRQNARAAVQAADQAAAAAERGAKKEEKAHEAALRRVAAIRERYFREEQARQDRAERTAIASQQKMASAAMRTFGGLARTGLSTLGTVAMGFGLDTSLAGGLARGISLESAAVAIANKGNRGGKVEDPKQLEQLARTTGDMFKVDPSKVLAGLDKFQSLTGDLNLGKIALKDLVGLSKAFKIDVDQLVGSAANVATKIGDVGKEFKTPEEKAKAVLDVMKALVAQGQEGAIEMPDLVTQLSALGAAAPRFEGSAAANISKMGAMAQLALQMGGAKSASQATTAVMGFANTLSTPARRAAFKAAGVDIDSTKEKGKFIDPFEIIKKSLVATGGDTDKMKKLFANVVGERAVRALTNSFLGAGGGQAGLAAVDKQFARFGGTVNDKQIQDNLGRELNTKASEAQAFQNELDKITSTLGTELAPALKSLAPLAVDVAKGLAGIVSFGAQHPGMAITAAIVASIGKAAVGEAVGKALGGAIGSAIGGMSGSTGLVLGAATIAIAAASIAIQRYKTEVTAGSTEAKSDIEKRDELTKRVAEQLKSGKLDPETINEFAQQRAKLAAAQKQAGLSGSPEEQMQKHADDMMSSGVRGIGTAVMDLFGAKSAETMGRLEGSGDVNAAQKEKLDAQAKSMDSLATQLKGVLKVHVENAGDLRGAPAGPTPNPAGQSGGVP